MAWTKRIPHRINLILRVNALIEEELTTSALQHGSRLEWLAGDHPVPCGSTRMSTLHDIKPNTINERRDEAQELNLLQHVPIRPDYTSLTSSDKNATGAGEATESWSKLKHRCTTSKKADLCEGLFARRGGLPWWHMSHMELGWKEYVFWRNNGIFFLLLGFLLGKTYALSV
jgi:hypothetical protein